MKRPRASDDQKAERLNCARIQLRQGDPRSQTVQRLAQDCALSRRQAYRYLEQAQHLQEPVSRGKAKLKFTVKLAPALIRAVRKSATKKRLSNSEVVSQALLAQVPRGGTPPDSVSAPGLKKTPIALELVEKLASVGCTLEEIGAVVGVSERTLIRREKNEKFRDAMKRGRSCGRVNLRRMMWKSAMGGNVRALIRLGKQMLGQRSFEGKEKNYADRAMPPLIIQGYGKDDPGAGKAEIPSASAAQKAERLNRAGILLRQGDPRSEAVQRLAQDCSLSPRQAYRYLEQTQHRTEPGEAKLALTLKLAPSLIQWVRTSAAKNCLAINEVVSRALLVQLGTLPGYTRTPGPEKTPISLELVEKLASIGCTLEEIGAVVGVSERTLIRREKDEKFRDAIDRGRSLSRVSLRSAQGAAAMRGNVRMQIWLGKQMLGQRSFEGEERNHADRALPPLIIQVSPEDDPGAGKA